MASLPRVSPYPIPELVAFLRPFRRYFYRAESLQVLERYITGLLAEVEHKSGAGVAHAVAELSESAVYRLLAETQWDASAVNRHRMETMTSCCVAGDGMLVVDDSGMPRQGQQCVGATHQYCGQLGKTANCQVVVTVDYVDPYFSWPVWGRLYLPKPWCQDDRRRIKAQIPPEITCQTKPEIALDLIDQARTSGVPFNLVGADGGYGDNPAFLEGLDKRQLGYVLSVACDFGVRLPQEVAETASRPLPAKRQSGRPRRHPHPNQVAPLHRADAMLTRQPETDWQSITWRMGSQGPLTKQFVALRLQRAHGDVTGPEGWLIGERPLPGHSGERKYYWSNLPVETPLARLAELAHRRPSIERTYQDGKSFTGFGSYPARLWHSYHRHLAIEMLTLSWLVLQQPQPATIEIVTEPQLSETPGQPVFPLRSRPIPQHSAGAAPGVRVPVYRVSALAGSNRSDRRITASRPAQIARQ
jgi:SRSO17 transposase